MTDDKFKVFRKVLVTSLFQRNQHKESMLNRKSVTEVWFLWLSLDLQRQPHTYQASCVLPTLENNTATWPSALPVHANGACSLQDCSWTFLMSSAHLANASWVCEKIVLLIPTSLESAYPLQCHPPTPSAYTTGLSRCDFML